MTGQRDPRTRESRPTWRTGAASLPGAGTPWWRRRGTIAAAVAVLVVAAGAVAWAVWPREDACAAAGLTEAGGQCVGVAESAFPGLDPSVAAVVARIVAQNSTVGEDYVEVALLGPLTEAAPDRPGQLDRDQLRQMLIGAAVAQQRVNTGAVVRDPRPQVRLVFANTGSYQDQWRIPVAQLVSRADRPDPRLVATVLLGTSLDHTRDAAAELARAEMPVVGTITSAEEFNSADIPGLVRVSPSSGDYVATLAEYLRAKHADGRAIVVWDRNSDRRGDLYTASLKTAFEEQLASWIGNRAEQGYVGASIPTESVWPQLFADPTLNICYSGADVVLYAGRVTDLPPFVEALAARACRDRPLLILTGAAALTAIDRTGHEQLRAAGLTLVYAGVTDPHTWPQGQGEPPPGYGPYRHALSAAGHLPEESDAYTCLAHDAVFTATLAIRMASEGRIPPRRNVLVAFDNINTGHWVPGCSGELTFTEDGDGVARGTAVQAVTIPYP